MPNLNIRSLYPNGKKTSEQKKSKEYFDRWIDYITECKNCNETILKDEWKYSDVKIEIGCDGCGVIYRFPTGKRNIKNNTPFTFNEELKTTENNTMSDETTTEVVETMDYNKADLPDSVLAIRKELTEKNTALEKGIKEKKKTINNARKKIKANDAEITRITKEAKSREEKIVKEKAVEWMKANEPDVFKSLSDN